MARLPLPALLSTALAAASGAVRAEPGMTGAAAIPFKPDAGAGAALLSGGATGVLLVSLIAIVAVLLIRKRLNLRLGTPAGPPLLRVLETRRMGPRTLLAVVEFGGMHYLVAQGEQGVTCLAQANPPTAAGERT